MKLPLKIVFRDISSSPAVEAEVLKRGEKLERFFDRVTSCRITLGSAGKHKHQGKLYQVHIDLSVPGGEIVVNGRHENEDIYVAIRDAFDAAARQLEDYVRQHRGDVKTHAEDRKQITDL